MSKSKVSGEAVEEREVPTDTEVKAKGKVTSADGTTEERSVTAGFPFGSDLNDAVNRYGEAAIHALYLAKGVVQVQEVIRRSIVEGKTPEEIQALVSEWYPGKTPVRARKDPAATLRKLMEGKSLEEIQALLSSAGVDL